MIKKTITKLLELAAEQNKLTDIEAKRIWQIILAKIDQWIKQK